MASGTRYIRRRLIPFLGTLAAAVRVTRLMRRVFALGMLA